MQTLYYGGDLITMVKETDAPEALLVKDGKIQYTGTLQEAKMLAGEDAEWVDLKGKTLMPSFLDGHSHISLYAQFAGFPDLSHCTDFEQIASFLQNYLKEHPQTEVLFAVNYDHNFLNEQEHPTRLLLDRISARIPIWIYHVSGHMGVANTGLLTMCGLTDAVKDPEGGHYGRFTDGTLSGYIEEVAAFTPILMKLFERLKMDPVKQLTEVQDIYLKHGVTTVQDGSANAQGAENFLQLANNHVLKVDVVSYMMHNDHVPEFLSAHPEIARKYCNHFKVAGSKIILDGSPQAKSAWISKPYEGEESYCGYGSVQDDVVLQAAKEAIQNGYQMLAHANGDAAADQLLRCYRQAMEQTEMPIADLRPVMIHCQTVREDQLDEMAEIGMLPSIFVAHTYFWGDIHLKNLGIERGSRISPVRSALKRGLKYNFHQDCPVLPPDMMRTIWCAVNRKTRAGVSIGEEQRISTFDALKGVTINTAYAYHEERKKGTLEAGKLADLVILDRNPLNTEPMELKEIQVLATIKEGVVLYQK